MQTRTLLKKMMSYRPVTADISAVNRLVDFVQAYLAQHQVFTRVKRLAGRKILYAGTRKPHPAVLLNAHLDVVPADEETFKYSEKNGWVYGRGSGDCLGNCAVLTNLLVRLKGRSNIGVIFSTDEETGGKTTRYMVAEGYGGELIMVLDGSGYCLAVAQKGILGIRLLARGRSCHGASPWLGSNAIDRLIAGYTKIRQQFPAVKRQPPDEWIDTLSANIIRGGTAGNRVPDEAELRLDVRLTDQTSPAAFVRKLRRLSGLSVDVFAASPAVACDPTHPRLRALTGFMTRHLRREIKVIRMNGATDARHFTPLGAPIAIIGVPSEGAHSAAERASLKGLQQYEEMLLQYCQESV